MSRTKRNILTYPDKNGNVKSYIVDDSANKHLNNAYWGNKKMKPYIKQHLGMWEGKNKWGHKDVKNHLDGLSYRNRTGLGARQSARNYNRSLKKGLRQQYKIEIFKEINYIQ